MLKRSSSALSTAKITILALAGIFLSELATAGFVLSDVGGKQWKNNTK